MRAGAIFHWLEKHILKPSQHFTRRNSCAGEHNEPATLTASAPSTYTRAFAIYTVYTGM